MHTNEPIRYDHTSVDPELLTDSTSYPLPVAQTHSTIEVPKQVCEVDGGSHAASPGEEWQQATVSWARQEDPLRLLPVYT